jgi:hypothetical protein
MSSKGVLSYNPKITCEFKLHDQIYSGTEYDFSANYTRKEKAQNKLDQVKCINKLKVFYKPTDPSINVIFPGIHLVHFVRLIIGLATIVISILSWVGVIEYGMG